LNTSSPEKKIYFISSDQQKLASNEAQDKDFHHSVAIWILICFQILQLERNISVLYNLHDILVFVLSLEFHY